MLGCANLAFTTLNQRLPISRSKGSSEMSDPTTPPRMPRGSKPSLPHLPTSPRNPANKLWIQEQQKLTFQLHLKRWADDHDSSLHFHGKLSLAALDRGACRAELGKPVKCVLTDTSFTDARQIIVIKLFAPHDCASLEAGVEHIQKDSLEPVKFTPTKQPRACTRAKCESRQDSSCDAREPYKLMIRSGSGWVSSREFFDKLYMSRLDVQQNNQVGRSKHDKHLIHRSHALGPVTMEEDNVTIRPLFHAFQKLPAELKELILMTAAGLSRSYDLRSGDSRTLSNRRKHRPAITLSTLFRISKHMTIHLQPYIYHSIDFHFGLTGFTNFLWQVGPQRRREIRRLTFHFGKLALLHCMRWLSPDAVFLLFEPPVTTNPRALQHYWRCQIQDLVRDVHLFTLTIDIKQIDFPDLVMIIAILKNAFGSIEKLRFIETNDDGVSRPVVFRGQELRLLKGNHTWTEMCREYYWKHRALSSFFKLELLSKRVGEFEEDLQALDEMGLRWGV